jgi:hypothetical protein
VNGGFVSEVFPETAYACWRQIRFDNARAHLAADSLDVVCELLGCTVDVGPAYEPDDRPFIEHPALGQIYISSKKSRRYFHSAPKADF